jgi:hypothetical protein
MKTFIIENPFKVYRTSGLITVKAEDVDKAKKLIKRTFKNFEDVDKDVLDRIREIKDNEVLWAYV